MLIVAYKHNVLPYMITIVAALSVQELFERDYGAVIEDADADDVRQLFVMFLNHRLSNIYSWTRFLILYFDC